MDRNFDSESDQLAHHEQASFSRKLKYQDLIFERTKNEEEIVTCPFFSDKYQFNIFDVSILV